MNLQSIRARVFHQFSAATDDNYQELTATYHAERRQTKRVEVETLVAAIAENGSRFEGYCRNLSQSGTAALIWGELQVGDRVCLAFRSLGSERETIIPAVVRNAISHRYGFEFTVPNESELHRLITDACRIEATYS